MSFMSDYEKELNKLRNRKTSGSGGQKRVNSVSKNSSSSNAFMESYYNELDKLGYSDLAPVSSRIEDRVTIAPISKKDEEEDNRKWYQKGHFEDGWDFGDVTKTILGIDEDSASLRDLTIGSAKRGFYNTIYGEESFKAMMGEANNRETYEKLLEGEEYQFTPGNDLASGISGAFELGGQMVRQFTNPRALAFTGSAVGAALIAGNAGPQALVPEEIISVPTVVTAALTASSAASSLEVEAGHAYNEMIGLGIKEDTAKKIALAVGIGNAGLEMFQVDELLDAYKATAKKETTQTVAKLIYKELADRGVDVLTETGQEVAQEGITILGAQTASYLDKGEYAYTADEVKGRLADTAKSSALSFGMMNVPATVKNTASIVSNQKQTPSLTQNEQAVVKKVYEDELEKAEQDGKLSSKEKTKIYNSVVERMQRGEISTDDIESVLGGKSYTAYDSLLKESEEFNTLYNTESGKLSEAQRDRLAELKKINESDPYENALLTSKIKLSQDVMGIVKDSRLMESYNERGRRSQAFEADLTKYDTKQQAVIQKAVDSGILNNTRRTHEFVDMVAKISADKGVSFDFTNNEKLKESGFAIEGKTVNGYVTADGVTLNIQSAKALNSVVGHEITHVLEGTELYDALREAVFNYAIAKEGTVGFNKRLRAIEQMYKDMDANPEGELTADLVGEYLFTDSDFISRLSTENRSVFKKIYDEIKYLYKVATAGSKELRQLEKVKKAFEEAYKADGNTANNSGTQYSLYWKPNFTKEEWAAVERKKHSEFDNPKFELDKDTNWMYFNEKGLTVFAVYSKHDAEDPTVLYGSRGNKAGRDYEKLSEYLEGRRRNVNRGRTSFDRLLAHIERNNENRRYGLPDTGGGKPATGDVSVSVEESGSNGRRNYEDGREYRTNSALTEYYKEASDDSGASSFITYGSDYGAIRNFMKEDPLSSQGSKNTEEMANDIAPSVVGTAKYSISDSNGNQLTAEQVVSEVTDSQNDLGLNAKEEVSYSLSNDTTYMDKAIVANDSMMRVDSNVMSDVKALRERIAQRMNDIKDRGLVGLPEDIEGNTYIANSSYDGTEENTTICPRSLASEAFVDAVSEYLGRPLTVEEQIYISQDLQGRSLTPECTYCYVATDRKAYRAFLGEYISQRDAVLQKIADDPNADVSENGELYKEFLNGRKPTKPMYNRFKMWVDAYKNGKPMIDASHLANINKLMGDINSEFGAELKPQIVDAMKYAQSASWAKKRVNYVAYNGHILKWKQDRINKLNSHYGLRMYSFSDFHPAFVLENMQMITDASVRGLKMLGYTKDTDFVEIFAPSGMNINVSTFGFEAGGEVFENNLIGAEWEKAKNLREQYPNVGVTFVATNDTLVNWALDQDWIDVVIPYHLVRTGAEVAKAFNYTNYTSESSDAKTKEWSKGDKKYIAPTEHNNDKATYLAALEKNHLKPRFERFLENPNYMKLVNECRQPASQSKPVQPVFNEDAAMVALAKLEANGYYQPIGGSVDRMYEIAGEVAEAMTQQIAPDTQLSLSEEGETQQTYGNYNVYGDDVAIAPEPTLPITENVDTQTEVAPETETTAPTISKTETVEEVGNTVQEIDDAPIDVSKSPVLKRLNQKLSNSKTELDKNQKLREDSNRSFDEKIATAKAQLDSKKNKDTKVANNLKRRIERLERLKADVDASYAKRITDIKSRISNAETDIQKYHPGMDRAEKANARIDRRLEADKAELTEEYNQKKEQLADKDSYISKKATELYNELRKLKKGVRASEQLGYLLDHGYDWNSIKSALVNIKHTPGGTVNINSEAESVAREMLDEDYENSQYALEQEYLKQIDELEAKADEKRKAASIANQRKAKTEEHSKRWEQLIGDTSTWKDMSMGLSYKTKTLRRILRKVVKDANGNPDIKKADRIYDELETKYDHNEARLKRESEKLKEVFFELKLNHAEDYYAHMLGELRHNPETTLTEEVVKEYYNKHKSKINEEKVNKAISEARKTFDDLIVRVNEVLREQGMKEIPYRKGYFPHFTNPKQGWLAKLLNWKTIDNEIPTSIAGLTEMFTPQRSWQSFNKQRTGDKTDYSLYQGLDTYIHGALDWIYHIDDLQSRRALENYLRYTHSEEGVKAKIDEIRANDSYDADETQKMIDAVLAEANNPLSGLVRELMNRTNTLANKKSSMDRGMEDATNRKIYSTMTNLNNRITANQVVGSVSSALTNFIPMVQSWHQVSPYFTVRGLGDYVRSVVKDDGMVAKSDFLTNRLNEEEKLYQTTWDKVSDKAAFMMNVVDSITSQTVWRSKYLQNIKEGMNESQAIKDADQFSKNLMAGRSRGNAPTIFDAKNPLVKIFTSFQLEVANQYGYMFEDVPQDSKNKARLVKGYAAAFLGAHMYNALYSALVGRDAAFDPIGIIQDLLGDLFDDEEEPEDIILNTSKNIIEEVPFVGGLFGGGRIPISSAFPYSGYTDPFESMLADVSEGDMKSLGKEMLKPLYYLAMPVAGGQIKKTVEGLSMFSDDHPIAGSYTTSGNLRFPVEDTIGSRIQAGLFGQYSSANARKYFDEEQKTLNAEQTEVFAAMGIPIEEYWEYRDNLNNLYDVKDQVEASAEADGATDKDVLSSRYVNAVFSNIYNLYDQQKAIASGNLSESEKQRQLQELQSEMNELVQSGINGYNNVKVSGAYATVGNKRFNKDAESGKWYEIKPKNADGSDNYYYQKEQEVTKGLGISYEAYWNNRDEYNFAYDKPAQYSVAKAVGGYSAYKGYTSALYDIKADKDENGKSISGTRKKKVIEYINGLNADYGSRIILYKMEYPSDDTYNYDIVEYLNSRDDISYKDMESILKYLGFNVDPKGNITW